MLKTLFLKEILLLAALTGLGAGLAVHLRSEQRSPVARLALAPALGLAVAAPTLVALNFLVPLRHALWFAVLPGMALSMGLAVRALRKEGGVRATVPPRRQLAQLALLGAVLFLVLNHPLDARMSQGPIGWGIFDGPGYITFIQGYTDFTNEKPLARPPESQALERYDKVAWGETWDISLRYGWDYKFQHTSAETVPAAVGGGMGWPPWQTIAPFMVVLLMIGALGTYALTATLGGRRAEWPALLAGLAFAGPVTFQIFIDGSAGLLAGLALLPALMAVGVRALERPRWTTTALLGGLFAGLQAVYPEILALPGAACVLVLAVLGLTRWRQGRLTRSGVLTAIGHLVLLAVLAMLLSPRTAPWTANYLYEQASSQSLFGVLIDYQMGLENLPGWLLQTREFYAFAIGPPQPLMLLTGVVLPLVLLAVGLVSLRAFPRSRVLLALVAVAVAQAYLTARSFDCSYCTQRSLITLAPVLPTLVALGLVALAASRRGRIVALALGAVATLAIGVTMAKSLDRTVTGAFMPTAYLEPMLGQVKKRVDAPLQLEGFAATPHWAWAEQPTTYAAVNQATGERLSTVAAYNEYGGYAYAGTRPVGHPVYTPRYRYVLTRLGTHDSGRREIARQGPLRLQERAMPFDVVVARGVAVDTPARDPQGLAWAQSPSRQLGFEQGPLTFWISALDSRRAYLRITLAGPPELRVTDPPGTRARRLPDGRFEICVPVGGSGALRIVSIGLESDTGPLLGSGDPLDPVPRPAQALRLDRSHATPEPCPAARAPKGG